MRFPMSPDSARHGKLWVGWKTAQTLICFVRYGFLQCLVFLPIWSHSFTDLIFCPCYSLPLISGCAIQLDSVTYSGASCPTINNPLRFLWARYSVISQASSVTLIKQVMHEFHPEHLALIILKHRSVSAEPSPHPHKPLSVSQSRTYVCI